MKLTKNMELINNSYRTLHERAQGFAKLLSKLGYSVEWGYYGQHSVQVEGEYYLEYYPIPVITVKDICDIGIDFTHVFAEGKLYTADASKLKLSMLKDYDFSIYGVENYLYDIYEDGMSDEELQESIKASGENEIAVSVELEGEPLSSELLELIKYFVGLGSHIIVSENEEEDPAENGSVFDDMDRNTPAFEIADALEND